MHGATGAGAGRNKIIAHKQSGVGWGRRSTQRNLERKSREARCLGGFHCSLFSISLTCIFFILCGGRAGGGRLFRFYWGLYLVDISEVATSLLFFLSGDLVVAARLGDVSTAREGPKFVMGGIRQAARELRAKG